MESKIIDKRKVIYEAGCSFRYESDTKLTTSLHCHSEYELIYVTAGHGREFVGDSVREYRSGDMVLIGTNLPHLYLSDTAAPEDNSCRILQFPDTLFPEGMEQIGEYARVAAILANSARGICFRSKRLKRETLRIMDEMGRLRDIERLLALFRLLDMLGRSEDIMLISSLKYSNPLSGYVIDDPVSQVFGFLINNHRRELTLDEIADHTGMNPASLCRYFRQRTGKTLFGCLAEIRVEYACKLLGNSHLTIAQIAWESGFRNQAHFNKQFRTVTGLTPTEYRNSLTI